MKKSLLLCLFFTLLCFTKSFSQPVMWFEGFETSDTANLPQGWTKWNISTNIIEDNWNWTVRDTGTSIPGLANATAKSHSGLKSVGVTWYAGLDTGGMSSNISDAWLVTRRIENVPSDGFLTFWVTGGTPNFSDSLQIWISSVDSIPLNILSDPGNYIQTLQFVGTPYGLYVENFVDLQPHSGQTVWVAFRYHQNVSQDGFFVQLDDVTVFGTVSITQIGTNIPDKFALGQNYPNPFNPVTKIKFDIAKNSNVKLTVFNSLGQVVKDIYNGHKPAGYYEAEFDASNLSSGTYYYRLETDNFVETKKMMVIK
jgi:hypothetical protein